MSPPATAEPLPTQAVQTPISSRLSPDPANRRSPATMGFAVSATAGIDTQATLDQLMALLSEPQHAYSALTEGRKRVYNQAWFAKIYIEAISDDADDTIGLVEERSPIATALDASRTMVSELATKKAGPSGPASFSDLATTHVRSSIKNPLVEHRRLELLTSSLPAKRSSQLS